MEHFNPNSNNVLEESNKSKAGGNFQRGRNEFEKGNFEEAIKYFEEALNLNSDHTLAENYLTKAKEILEHSNKAKNNFESGCYEKAAISFATILNCNPNSNILDMILKQVECYVFTKKLDEAEKILKTISNGTKKNFEYYRLKGFISYYQGKTADAIKSFEEALKLDKTDTKSLELLLEKSKKLEKLKLKGNELFKKDDYENAILAYTDALEKCSEIDSENKGFQSIIFHNRGLVQKKIENLVSCIEDCTSALNLNQKYLNAIKMRAYVYDLLDKFEESSDDYKAALNICPLKIEFKDKLHKVQNKIEACKCFQSAKKEFECGNIYEASKLFEKTLKWNPDHKEAETSLKKSKLIENRCAEAEEAIQDKRYSVALEIYEAIHSENNNETFKINQAECYILMQQQKESFQILKSLSNEMKNKKDYHYVNGLYLHYHGEIKSAKLQFKEAIKLDKSYKKSLEMINKYTILDSITKKANEFYREKEYKKAELEYTDAIHKISSDDINKNCFLSVLYRNRALALSKLKKSEACVKDCTKALDYNPNYFNVFILRAKEYINLGHIKKSKEDYNKALNIENIDEKEINLIKDKIKRACKKAYKQSQEQLENGNINKALKFLNETLIWDEKHTKANKLIEKIKLIQNNFSKAEELIEKSKFNEALKIYEDIIYLHPNDFNNKIKLKQAECFFLLGQYDKVEGILNSVSTSSKKITEFYYVTGHYRYYKGSLNEAKENFESACNLDKNHTKALNMLEKCKSLLIYIDKADSLSQSQAAIEEYSKAIDMIPKNDQKNYAILCSLFVKRAQVNLNMNNRNACITDCSNALEIDETYWQALFLRAKAYKSSGTHRQCITDCEEAIKFSDSVEVRILLIETEIELERNNSRTHYDLLGINRQASDREITNAYRKTARKFHPDKYSKVPSTLKTAITKLMQKANSAYETLKDKQKKKDYDDEIRSR